MRTRERQAFTLIEIMVVICVIAILMMASFKLLRAATYNKKIAETRAKMERLQNALSGYYAYYGHYPEVPLYTSLDPKQATAYDDEPGSLGADDWEGKAEWCARAQPIAFEYPTASLLNEAIPKIFAPRDVVAVNKIIDSVPIEKANWDGGMKLFKFGLISFLLPRLEVAHFSENSQIDTRAFRSAQWLEANPTSPRDLPPTHENIDKFARTMQGLRQAENEACARWLPQLEALLQGSGSKIMGINLWEKNSGSGLEVRPMGSPLNRLVAVQSGRCLDAWGHTFYYHSLPPYQSYILWSAGDNGRTYPPWIDSRDASSDYGNAERKKKILEWVKDDIVGGSM